MTAELDFSLLNARGDGNSDGDSDARCGRLVLQGRNPVNTPHYVAVSSRGTVPHITPDNFNNETSIKGIYAGLEDYVEQRPRATPPAYAFPCKPGESPLRRFVALKSDALLVLGPRRVPALSPPPPNTYTSMTISTSTGFRQLEVSEYIAACERLRPDVAVAPVDYELGEGRTKPGLRRRDKMGERTLAWVRGTLAASKDGDGAQPWAPMLPIEPELQQSYLEFLAEEASSFGGVAVYETDSVAAIPPPLRHLPRISFSALKTPHELLHAVDVGIDLFTLPFVTKATDAGVAFTFDFDTQVNISSKKPLGLDLWSETLSTDLSPLKSSCTCYACRTHHRAYLRHLLDAKEMLAWTLLQIHNHHQMDAFFSAIRNGIEKGTFTRETRAFTQAYEDDFPIGSGEGPRLRGYQIRISQAGPAKVNMPARKKLDKANLEAIEAARAAKGRLRAEKLDDDAQKVGEVEEAGLFAPDVFVDVGELERKGYADKD